MEVDGRRSNSSVCGGDRARKGESFQSLSMGWAGRTVGGGAVCGAGGRRALPSVPNRTGQFLLIIEPSVDNKI